MLWVVSPNGLSTHRRPAHGLQWAGWPGSFRRRVPGVPPGAALQRLVNTTGVEFLIDPNAANEELRLWADYYEATARVLEIMRTQGTTQAAFAQILAEDARAAVALQRIKELRGIKS
jgi:hypothetical protein